MGSGRENSNEQAQAWNGVSGHSWVAFQALLDRMLKPIEELLADAAETQGARTVLDVGCGTGGTTLAVARKLGVQAKCTGIDISDVMLEVARMGADSEGLSAGFVRADAQTYAFEPRSFDLIMSRYGVMFFDDFIQAFANLRKAARESAALRCVVWRGAEDNPFMTTAEKATAHLLPALPPRLPNSPGQFALADKTWTHQVLAAAGWNEIDIQPIDIDCAMPESDLLPYMMSMGPVGRALPGADDRIRTAVAEALRPAFEPYVRGTEVCFNAACWMLEARA